MTRNAKILLVDDHEAVIQGVRSIVSRLPGVQIVGMARDGFEAVEKYKALKPDLVIMDISMPRMDGVEATRQIRAIDENCRVIVYSMYSDQEYVLALFRAGISGYVLKEDMLNELVNALEAVWGGANYYAEAIRETVQKHMLDLESGRAEHREDMGNDLAKLSTREKEVFPLLADGLTVKEIAALLCISPKTVETHKYNIMEKLNTRSIADLTKIAIKGDLIKF